ncbi:PREDICTED: uncharacterized protein LOC109178646 isoform X2 [Ipomoea nil]|uniref:uncharacterized protein LOC109178646 isoform X2 n=1 Tax=Ipomoea nil TaxID=35883 RepID=UPI000901D15A|nr:PREDICTED: uncharacterized protein LOC109178646 isoform X2 [Ipomoea nil]
MAGAGGKWRILRPLVALSWSFLLASAFVSAERSLKNEEVAGTNVSRNSDDDYLSTFVNFLWQPKESGYDHIWPEMELGWEIVIGSIIGFMGAAFGSVGGVGGGGIFVPMLSLVVGFDPKSATAISKCMIMGAAVSSVHYNLKLRHPTLDMPIIDYDLAVLIQPMLMLGISIGVTFNVIFADWMVTVLLIVLFIGTSTKAFLRGVETWKKETILKKEVSQRSAANGSGVQGDYKLLPSGPSNATQNDTKASSENKVSIIENVCWTEFGLLCFVWVSFLALQIIKNYTATCSALYWIVNLLQIPVSVAVTLYEAIGLNKGWRKISSKGESESNLQVTQLLAYCFFGLLAGVVGGLLGLGGGFIMGPLFLELGIPPHVSSATATFAMMFSSSMSVVEYYLLKRFPVPYAIYFMLVATVAAFIGQHVVRKLIMLLGRASLIIFILAFTIFVSAVTLGGVGISNMIWKINHHEYMGFENLCTYEV